MEASGRSKNINKPDRIKKEKLRLGRIYKDIEKRKRATVEGLIERAAYMRVSLDDLEQYLNDNGFVEMFQQGETQKPYERKRPNAEIYQNMNNSYQKIVKQLSDLLPREELKPQEDDGLMGFINGREDD